MLLTNIILVILFILSVSLIVVITITPTSDDSLDGVFNGGNITNKPQPFFGEEIFGSIITGLTVAWALIAITAMACMSHKTSIAFVMIGLCIIWVIIASAKIVRAK